MSTVAEVIMKRNGLDENHLDYFVPHQANKRIIDVTTKRLALSKEKVLINIEHFCYPKKYFDVHYPDVHLDPKLQFFYI